MPKSLQPRAPRWQRLGPQIARRITFETPDVRFALYRLAAGFRNLLHAHESAQMDVVISGRGIHRAVFAIARAGRIRQEVREVEVHDGDCFYVPSRIPHELAVDAGRPMVLLEVTLSPRRSGHIATHPRADPTRPRGPRGR